MEKFQLEKCVFWEFPQKSICGKISKKINLWENFQKKLCCWKISTKIFFFCWKISTKLRFVGKFSQKNCFVGKFPQKNAFLDNFDKKKQQCWIITTKISLPPSPTPAPPPTPWKFPKSSWKKFLGKYPESFGFNLTPPPFV